MHSLGGQKTLAHFAAFSAWLNRLRIRERKAASQSFIGFVDRKGMERIRKVRGSWFPTHSAK
jgi:hypothetical protein